jgi:LCP family protein required for cell wall assembly
MSDFGQYGPPLRGGKPRTRASTARRVGVVALSTVLVGTLLLTLVAGALVLYGERSLERIDVDFGEPPEHDGPDIDELTEVLNVVVVGNDSREGLTDEQLLRLGTEDHGGQLTDTVMLLQLDPRRDKAALLSFPRDLLVTRCDGSRGRINAAYVIGEQSGVGGASCLVQTVRDFTGITVHHYVEVNFAGFVDVVDTVGGVTMYLDEPIRDLTAGLDLPSGCVTMDGIDALSFVRARQLDDDFGRMARQQRFVRELTREITSVGTLLNVPRLFSLVDSVGRAVETDRDLSLGEMRRIAFSLRTITPESLDTRTVPAVPRRVNGAALVVAKEEEAERLFQAFRDGTVFPDELGTEPPAAVGVSDVPPVLVLNGAGIPGLAAEVAAALTERGFEVSDTDNAENFDFVQTQVVYPAQLLEEAELLAQALGGVSLVPGDPDDELIVVVGSAFEMGSLPPIAETPTATPDAEPAPEFRGAQPSDVEC